MMTDEELDALIEELSGQLEKIPEDTRANPLSREQRKQKAVLRVKCNALGRMKEARVKGDLQKEVQAGIDYHLMVQFGHRHSFFLNFIKSQLHWF